MLPGQFEAFAHRKAFRMQQVRDDIRTGAASTEGDKIGPQSKDKRI
jgi:hypothetical protein